MTKQTENEQLDPTIDLADIDLDIEPMDLSIEDIDLDIPNIPWTLQSIDFDWPLLEAMFEDWLAKEFGEFAGA